MSNPQINLPSQPPASNRAGGPFGPMEFVAPLASAARTIRIASGLNLAVAESGPPNGEAVMLVHGLQDEADTWRHVFAELARTHRVIALDLPGFGRSDKPHARYDIPFFADAACSLLDALGISRAHWVGSSLGAMICEFIALKRTQRVQTLTLVDGTLAITRRPSMPAGALLRMLFADWQDRCFFAALRKSPDAAYATLKPYYADLAAMPAEDRTFLYRRVNQRVWDEPQRIAALATRTALPYFMIRNASSLQRAVTGLRVPTHVVWGAQDHILSSENGRARAEMQDGARCIEIPSCGHLPQQERPSELLDAVAFT